jgi:hypothetical protein
MAYTTLTDIHMDDKVIPASTDPRENGKTLTVTDIHPGSDGQTAAVTLWDGWREHTSRTTLFTLVSRHWD